MLKMATIFSSFWRILLIISLIPQCSYCSMWNNDSAFHYNQGNSEVGDSITNFKPFKIPIMASYHHSHLGHFHYVTLELGNPKQDVQLYVASSSSVPLVNCFSQPNRNVQHFDQRSSHSFNFIKCPSQQCSEMNYSGTVTCSGLICGYRMLYERSNEVDGGFGSDLLTLTSHHRLPNFLFGCNMRTINPNFRGTGLLGLGLNKGSFQQQFAKKYGSIFSYCLPSSRPHVGYLKIGNDVSSTVKYTSLVDSNGAYGLELVGIKVDGTKLAIDPTILSQKTAIIATETTVSYLPKTAYNALRKEFQKKMINYPKTEPLSILDTCYDMRGMKSVVYPSIGLIFKDEVEVSIAQSGVVHKEDSSHVCLAFVGHDEDEREPIIGGMAQKTWEVAFDIGREQIGIGPKGCL